MDEMGHPSWADAPETICFVPSEFPESAIYVLISRIGKRITVTACIGADDSFLHPGLMISPKTFEDE
jgi:hypothetical protein